IVKGAEARGLTLAASAAKFQSLTGKGVLGEVEGRKVLLGNAALLAEQGIDMQNLSDRAQALRSRGHTVMFLGVEGRPAGLISVADPIRESTREAVGLLHAEGLRIIMLSGDNKTAA